MPTFGVSTAVSVEQKGRLKVQRTGFWCVLACFGVFWCVLGFGVLFGVLFGCSSGCCSGIVGGVVGCLGCFWCLGVFGLFRCCGFWVFGMFRVFYDIRVGF